MRVDENLLEASVFSSHSIANAEIVTVDFTTELYSLCYMGKISIAKI